MEKIILIILLMMTPNELRTSNGFRKSLRRIGKTAQAVEREQYADSE